MPFLVVHFCPIPSTLCFHIIVFQIYICDVTWGVLLDIYQLLVQGHCLSDSNFYWEWEFVNDVSIHYNCALIMFPLCCCGSFRTSSISSCMLQDLAGTNHFVFWKRRACIKVLSSTPTNTCQQTLCEVKFSGHAIRRVTLDLLASVLYHFHILSFYHILLCSNILQNSKSGAVYVLITVGPKRAITFLLNFVFFKFIFYLPKNMVHFQCSY